MQVLEEKGFFAGIDQQVRLWSRMQGDRKLSEELKATLRQLLEMVSEERWRFVNPSKKNADDVAAYIDSHHEVLDSQARDLFVVLNGLICGRICKGLEKSALDEGDDDDEIDEECTFIKRQQKPCVIVVEDEELPDKEESDGEFVEEDEDKSDWSFRRSEKGILDEHIYYYKWRSKRARTSVDPKESPRKMRRKVIRWIPTAHMKSSSPSTEFVALQMGFDEVFKNTKKMV